MEQTENPGRERILARIRAALRKPAPMHVASGATRAVHPSEARTFYPPFDPSRSETMPRRRGPRTPLCT